jgi:hypothetical protein
LTGSGTTYNVAVSGMSGNEAVFASVPAGVAHDAVGIGNLASMSIDNSITYYGPPTIGGVVITPEQGLITWNALDFYGIASSRLEIGNTNISKIYGPYAASSGVNYAGVFGTTLLAGSYNYTITATDKLGNTSQYTGSFNVTGPTISGVVVAAAQGLMTWNVLDSGGVANASFTVDGKSVSMIYGPYAATSGVNYAGAFGTTLSAGIHNYIITATDEAGRSSQSKGTFDVPPPNNSGPTISGVVISMADGVMTWNAADTNGVASSSLTVDGTAVSEVYGPYAAASGLNYAGVFGTALSAGSHNYTITVTDNLGNSSTFTGAINVPAATTSAIVAKSLAKNAVLSSLATKPSTSAKVDWLYDGTDSVSTGSTTQTMDTALASF